MMKSKAFISGTIVLLLALVGCDNSSRASEPQASEVLVERADEGAKKTKVAKIVFVGAKQVCDCTRSRIEEGWATLQEALGASPKLPVERLKIDLDKAQVEPYREQKAIMALPAIYFVDGQAKVLDLLQGEVTVEKINAVLKR